MHVLIGTTQGPLCHKCKKEIAKLAELQAKQVAKEEEKKKKNARKKLEQDNRKK